MVHREVSRSLGLNGRAVQIVLPYSVHLVAPGIKWLCWSRCASLESHVCAQCFPLNPTLARPRRLIEVAVFHPLASCVALRAQLMYTCALFV
jgi:hypothetical protein